MWPLIHSYGTFCKRSSTWWCWACWCTSACPSSSISSPKRSTTGLSLRYTNYYPYHLDVDENIGLCLLLTAPISNSGRPRILTEDLRNHPLQVVCSISSMLNTNLCAVNCQSWRASSCDLCLDASIHSECSVLGNLWHIFPLPSALLRTFFHHIVPCFSLPSVILLCLCCC